MKPKSESAEGNLLLQANRIVKRFGDFAANDDVTLHLGPSRIHALLGENGAGKSTLVKILYGALQPTSGELKWRGNIVSIPNPAAARRLGIGMVFQHFSLFESLSVAENIALALPRQVSLKTLPDQVAEVSSQYGLPLEPHALVADLSVGERQRIEIVRCLLQEPRLLIMDEPTAVLTPQEAGQLFLTLERLAFEGCAILYISHRLAEVQALCHEATILRHGKIVSQVDPARESAASLARLMVGADVQPVSGHPHNHTDDRPTVAALRVCGLNLPADGPFGVVLRDIHFEVACGEVLAIAGVAGNGQSELFDALSGERLDITAGDVRIEGRNCRGLGISERRALAAAFVPEERLGHGAVPELALSDNVILTRHASDPVLAWRGLLNRSEAAAIAGRVEDDYDVRASRTDPQARALSGGNLQKFMVGRELDRQPRLLVINQPTWGVDAGAAALIRQALLDLALAGAAVLVISQDLDEIFEIADRIAVLSRGELSPLYPKEAIDLERIGLLMAGAHESVSDLGLRS